MVGGEARAVVLGYGGGEGLDFGFAIDDGEADYLFAEGWAEVGDLLPAGIVVGFAVVGVPLDAGMMDAVAVEVVVLAVMAGDKGMAVVLGDKVEELGEEGWVDSLDEFVVAGL